MTYGATIPSDWFHFTMVYHGPNKGVTQYINGALAGVNGQIHGLGLNTGSGSMVLGRREKNADKLYADLKMDDLTLWDEEFDADDVRNLYNAY